MAEWPFPHVVIAHQFQAELMTEAARTWPSADWPGWVEYDARYEAKKASDLRSALPPACAELLRLMALQPIGKMLGLTGSVPDLSLHGGGCHELPPGKGLGLHLDSDVQPRLGLSRAWSAVLYIHEEWKLDWGGNLELWGSPPVKPIIQIPPLPGRLVAFATGDQSWHSVSPVNCPKDVSRKSLALFGYGPGKASVRPRAQFIARPGETDSPEIEAARLSRAV